MKLTSLMLALAAAGAACGGASPPAGKYLTGTLSQSTPSPCITALIATPGGQPACTVFEQIADGGSTTDVMLPWCLNASGTCWGFVPGTETGCSGAYLTISNNGASGLQPGVTYSYSCLLCSSSSPPPPGC